ncbi:MAG: 4-alpha-glucanotransferase [Clostridium sp.]
MIPVQDYLGLGNWARTNEPSTLGKNWRWRMKKDDLTPELLAKCREMAETYGRVKKRKSASRKNRKNCRKHDRKTHRPGTGFRRLCVLPVLFQICVLLLKGSLCGSGCRIGFCIRELCVTLGSLRIDCAALQSFYIALFVWEVKVPCTSLSALSPRAKTWSPAGSISKERVLPARSTLSGSTRSPAEFSA